MAGTGQWLGLINKPSTTTNRPTGRMVPRKRTEPGSPSRRRQRCQTRQNRTWPAFVNENRWGMARGMGRRLTPAQRATFGREPWPNRLNRTHPKRHDFISVFPEPHPPIRNQTAGVPSDGLTQGQLAPNSIMDGICVMEDRLSCSG